MSKWSGGLVNYRLWMYASITHLCRCLSSYRQLAVALSVWVSLKTYCSITACFSSKQLQLFGSLVNVMGE